MPANIATASFERASAGTVPPAVSVLLPVYNAEAYVGAAIDSILAQTFQDFELLIFDDGSTDGSLSILRDYEAKDSRIRVFSSPENRGVALAMNDLIEKARGRYIARMDADDICLPERLARQVKFLDSSPDHVVVGTWVEHMNTRGQPIGIIQTPLHHDEIDASHLKGHCSIWHPSAMIRASSVRSVGGYHEDFPPAEDIELWLRLAEIGKFANIPQVLVRYRLHKGALSERQRMTQLERVRLACEKTWARRGIAGTFEATSHWRPGTDRKSRHSFALRYGWVAWNNNHRNTWWTYVLEAFRLRPFALDTWKLFFFGLMRKPGDRLLDRHG